MKPQRLDTTGRDKISSTVEESQLPDKGPQLTELAAVSVSSHEASPSCRLALKLIALLDIATEEEALRGKIAPILAEYGGLETLRATLHHAATGPLQDGVDTIKAMQERILGAVREHLPLIHFQDIKLNGTTRPYVLSSKTGDRSLVYSIAPNGFMSGAWQGWTTSAFYDSRQETSTALNFSIVDPAYSISPDGSHAYCSGLKNSLPILIDLNNNSRVDLPMKSPFSLGSFAFSENGTVALLSLISHGEISIFDLNSRSLRTIPRNANGGNLFGPYVASNGSAAYAWLRSPQDLRWRLYDILADAYTPVATSPHVTPLGVNISPDGKRAYAWIQSPSSIELNEIPSGDRVPLPAMQLSDIEPGISFSPAGDEAWARVRVQGSWQFFNILSWESITPPVATNHSLHDIRFSPCGTLAYSWLKRGCSEMFFDLRGRRIIAQASNPSLSSSDIETGKQDPVFSPGRAEGFVKISGGPDSDTIISLPSGQRIPVVDRLKPLSISSPVVSHDGSAAFVVTDLGLDDCSIIDLFGDRVITPPAGYEPLPLLFAQGESSVVCVLRQAGAPHLAIFDLSGNFVRESNRHLTQARGGR